jgi:hypothetical protein
VRRFNAAQPFQIMEAEMQAKAKEYGIWLLPGSIFEKSEGNIQYSLCY